MGGMQIFRHYKGGLYELLGEARHSETMEDLVVYRSCMTGELWVRPKVLFYGRVGAVSRFEEVFQ